MGQLEHFDDATLVLAMRRVEVVLDAVVGAASQLFGDLGPLVALLLVESEDLALFLFADRILLNVRV